MDTREKGRDDARVGNLAKHEWVLVYAIDEATTAIPTVHGSAVYQLNSLMGTR